IAVSDDGARPKRPRRRAVPRTPNPQSISIRVPPASTTRPLPSLPLPREAKRMPCAAPLLELVAQEREDLLAGCALVGGAVRVLNGHEAARIGFRDVDPVLLDLLGVGLPEHELVEDPLLLRGAARF